MGFLHGLGSYYTPQNAIQNVSTGAVLNQARYGNPLGNTALLQGFARDPLPQKLVVVGRIKLPIERRMVVAARR